MSEFEFDIVVDHGDDIDSFLEGPRPNQYVEQIVSLNRLKLMRRAAENDDEVNVIELAGAGSEYIIRGDRSSRNPIVPDGNAWIAIASADRRSLSAFHNRVEN